MIVESDSGFYFIDSSSEYMGEHIDENHEHMIQTVCNILILLILFCNMFSFMFYKRF